MSKRKSEGVLRQLEYEKAWDNIMDAGDAAILAEHEEYRKCLSVANTDVDENEDGGEANDGIVSKHTTV